MKRLSIIALTVVLAASSFLYCVESPAMKGARLYYRDRQYPEAKEQLTIVMDREPDNAEAPYLMGEIYFNERDYETGNKYFDMCLAISDKYRGNIMQSRDRVFGQYFNGAVRIMNNAQREENEELKTESLERLIVEAERALVVRKEERAYDIIGSAYIMLNNIDKACEYFIEALKLNPESRNALQQLGYMNYSKAIQANNNEALLLEAIKYWEQLVEKYPETKPRTLDLGYAYELTNQMDKAIVFYDDLLTEHSDNVFLLTQLGAVKYNTGDQEGAEELFKKALEYDPENVTVLHNIADPMFVGFLDKMRGGEQVPQEDWEAILPYFEELSVLDAENAQVWDFLSVVYIRLEMLDKADAAAAKAKELKEIK
ncbi:tetratricopeptide repeat protein [candidate division KSB1 bacterium]